MRRRQLESPDAAIECLVECLQRVGIDPCETKISGRILASDVNADRDSPAADVSAMDGYAILCRDLADPDWIPVVAESACGSPPPIATDGGAVRIFTGAIVPPGYEVVIKREETMESPVTPGHPLGCIRWRDAARANPIGANIRRRGENLCAGQVAVASGVCLNPPAMAAIASFGKQDVKVRRSVRVAILSTGDELTPVDHPTEQLPPWMIRNSNAIAIRELLRTRDYVSVEAIRTVRDDRDDLSIAIALQMETSDVVLLTGGVSMGDYDFVPEVLESLGVEIRFHKLPLRPGRPVLGAVGRPRLDGRRVLVLGLPGNPVSTTLTMTRLVLPVIDFLSGRQRWQPQPAMVQIENADEKTLPLYWMRCVRLTGPGRAELLGGKGSGDLVHLADSDGFIEQPPGAAGSGPWPLWLWR